MSTTTPPSGYLKRKVAQSPEEAIAQYSVDNIKSIVKSAIQKYLESFFSRQGGNRDLFEKISKMGLQYITDQSFDPASDTTLRKTQLARMFEQVRRELPCILILDTGFEYIHQNWTGLDKVWFNQGTWNGRIHIARNLKLQIAIGTRDQASCDFLHGLISVLFGEMLFLGSGTRITGNESIGETWVVKMAAPSLGTVTSENLNEDPKDKVWMCSIDLENVLFEDSVGFSQPLDKFGPAGQGVINEPDLGWTSPTIYLDEEIPVNQSAPFLLDYFQPDLQQIIIKNPNIATLDLHNRTVNPRRLGTTEIQVIRQRREAETEFDNQTGSKYVVVASKTFKVVAT